MAIDPAFREKITGSPEEKAYDVTAYRKPENPELPEFGGRKLAANNEEYLLLELLPAVAKNFLRKRREEDFKNDTAATEAQIEAAVEENAPEPITGPVLSAPMCGRIVEINVKPGQHVSKGDVLLVYEAMKMENDIEAEEDCTVKRILVDLDQQVANDTPLIEFE